MRNAQQDLTHGVGKGQKTRRPSKVQEEVGVVEDTGQGDPRTNRHGSEMDGE